MTAPEHDDLRVSDTITDHHPFISSTSRRRPFQDDSPGDGEPLPPRNKNHMAIMPQQLHDDDDDDDDTSGGYSRKEGTTLADADSASEQDVLESDTDASLLPDDGLGETDTESFGDSDIIDDDDVVSIQPLQSMERYIEQIFQNDEGLVGTEDTREVNHKETDDEHEEDGMIRESSATPPLEDSPFFDTLESLAQGKSVAEQNDLFRAMVLDLLQEVDSVYLELTQVHQQLVQRDQLIQDLRDERSSMKEEYHTNLLSVTNALKEVDQQQAVQDLMKRLESHELIPPTAAKEMVIQKLTKKVEQLELENASLKEKSSTGSNGAGKLPSKLRWGRRRVVDAEQQA